jgi:hypothetical protein
MSFDPCNCPLKIRKSIGTLTLKVGAHLGVWGFIPSHSHRLLKTWMWFLGFILGSHLCKPLPWLQAQGYGCETESIGDIAQMLSRLSWRWAWKHHHRVSIGIYIIHNSFWKLKSGRLCVLWLLVTSRLQ